MATMNLKGLVKSGAELESRSNGENEEIWKQSLLSYSGKLTPASDEIRDGFDSKFGPFESNTTASEDQFKLSMQQNLQSRMNVSLINPSSLTCHLKEQIPHVSKVIEQLCSRSNSKLDVPCVSACGIIAVEVQEAQQPQAGFATEDTMQKLHQLAGYMLSVVSFSVWGVMKSTKPIVGLLVYPSAIYRLSICKPEDSNKFPLGLHHKLEYTADPLMMGWFLETFVRDYEVNHLNVKRMESTLDFEHVDPADWTCINFKFGTPLDVISGWKLGFLFESDGKRLLRWMDCISKQHGINELIQCEEIPMGEKLVVKYLSALAIDQPEENSYPVLRLVEAQHRAQQMDALARQRDAEMESFARQRDAQMESFARQKDAENKAAMEALARQKDAEKEALIRQKDAEKEELIRQIARMSLAHEAWEDCTSRPADVKSEAQSASMLPSHTTSFIEISPESKRPPEIAEMAQESEASIVYGPADIKSETQSAASPQLFPAATPPTTASKQPSPSKSCFKIKHPYIAVMTTALVHPFLIMRNVGTSLAVMSAHGAFLGKWKACQDLRLKFRDDVGMSALNLVEGLKLCHNDIQLSNIAVHDDSFCLMCFDHSRPDVPSNALESLVLRRYYKASSERNMMYTIAQIGVVVFALDTGAQAAEVRDVFEYWLTEQQLKLRLPHSKHQKGPNSPKSRQRRSLANFDAWIKSKGSLIEKVFSETVSSAAMTRESKGYFVCILDAMLA